MQQNELSITITAAQEAAILTKIDDLRALLAPLSHSLTDEERASFFKLGDARFAFDQKCDNYLHQRADLVPAAIDLAEYEQDGAAWAAISRILAKLASISEPLVDANIVLGADRLDADLIFYNYLEYAGRTGVPGAAAIHADLKTVFPGRRARRTPATTTPPTP